ncbi:hypothetical protein ACFQZT_22870 [Paenibacillus sp. GCM10027628]|uniref:hypothetical protein n=1 Tax=Paenibacillus sp. GCM10027628 TaxID=3273413 RepID=UPI003635B0D0
MSATTIQDIVTELKNSIKAGKLDLSEHSFTLQAINGLLANANLTLESPVITADGTEITIQGSFTLFDANQLQGDLWKSLPDAIQHFSGLALQKLVISFIPDNLTITSVGATIGTTAPWIIVENGLSVSKVQLAVTIQQPGDSSKRTFACQIDGDVEVGGVQIGVLAELPNFVISGHLAEGETLSVSAIVEHFLPAAASSIPELSLATLNVKADPRNKSYSIETTSSDTWTLPLGVTNLSIGHIAMELDYDSSHQPPMAGHLSGQAQIADADFQVSLALPGDFKVAGQIPTISFKAIIEHFCGKNAYPSVLPDFAFDHTNIYIEKQADTYNLVFGTHAQNLGVLEAEIQKRSDSWEFAGGVVTDANWRLSNISDIFKPLAGLNFVHSTLIVSSFTDSSYVLPNVELPKGQEGVISGLNYFATLQLDSQGLEAISHLLRIDGLDVHAAIGTDLKSTILEASLEENLQIVSGVVFKGLSLALKPSPILTIDFHADVEVQLHGDTLDFRGDVAVAPGLVDLSFGMQGIWHNPFGIKGLAIGNTFLDMQMSPDFKVGVAGEIDFNETIKVKVACQLMEGEVPDLLDGELQGTVSLHDIVKSFSSLSAIPASLTDVSISDAQVYVVANPLGAKIGPETYPPGMALKGKLHAYGIDAIVKIAVGDSGIDVAGTISPIRIGNYFQLTGVHPEDGAALALQVNKTNPLQFYLSGQLNLLGFSRYAEVNINSKSVDLNIGAKIFNAFQADIKAHAPVKNFTNGDFSVTAALKDDLFKYIESEAGKAFKAASDSAISQISGAQAKVNDAQAKVNQLNNTIADTRKQIASQQSTARNNIASAQSAVNDAKDKVDSLQNQINDMQHKIDSLSRFDPRKAYYGTQLAALYVAKKTADAALSVAQQALSAAQSANKLYPVDSDPRIVALLGSLETATAALKVATQFLDGVKQTVRGALGVSDYIVKYGLGALLAVRSASFTGQLQAVSSGKVSLAMEIVFMNKQQNLSIDFLFQNPIAGVQSLVDRLMKQL